MTSSQERTTFSGGTRAKWVWLAALGILHAGVMTVFARGEELAPLVVYCLDYPVAVFLAPVLDDTWWLTLSIAICSVGYPLLLGLAISLLRGSGHVRRTGRNPEMEWDAVGVVVETPKGPIRYPFHYTNEWGEVESLDNEMDLCTHLEFYDSRDEDEYLVYDADGQKLLLVVDKLVIVRMEIE